MQQAFRLATCVSLFLYMLAVTNAANPPTEAPTGFDNLTNGLISQTEFDKARDEFEQSEGIETGLGPVYNAQSCVACHGNPVTGGLSQVTELRSGHTRKDGSFEGAPGGSLLNDASINSLIQERVPDSENVRTLRTSLNILGDGFIEAIDDEAIRAIALQQPVITGGLIAGKLIEVPLAEAPGLSRVGRFGWKNQQASLLSFAGDAYLNEMGITNRLFPTENTSMGHSVADYDLVADPEDSPNKVIGDQDIDEFATFMRATKAPPRDAVLAATPAAVAGSHVFDTTGCSTCHVGTFTTLPAGALINGGTFAVPPALGNKVFHPFSDFLLHDVGTGDGIVQNGDQSTARAMRTPPLWGVRTRSRLMHDGQSLTTTDAILRHAGEAVAVTRKFRGLTTTEKSQLLAFLSSL
jgi:CxxC motif-containing protein (DUF1111 family)